MFNRILVANRGEIACRVMRTAARMGVQTVAVYSDADGDAQHVKRADHAIHIGAAPALESYLNGDRVIAAALESGAEAIHPGYGFLSENAAFATAVEAAGLAFIGPPPAAIATMGSKIEAKRLMERAGVPLVPGYHGDDQSDEALTAAAQAVGFPLMIKASAGGGGKGMRVVHGVDELRDALAGARRESKSAFASDALLLERYLTQPRHIEIQVFADRAGNCVHLLERDCSIQRRHQKIIEEAPGPAVSDDLRQRMGQAAVTAARSIGYVGAGTVEFIVEAGEFHFMEMNTRLQVEHPVTEMITGVDLVEWQLRIASGEPLPKSQDEIVPRGHAIEVRLYSEDPAKRYPVGTLDTLEFPPQNTHVRIDSGVVQGDAVSPHYDPMIAKIIVWDQTRAAALQRLRQVLEQTRITGVKTNLGMLLAVASNDHFNAADFHTGFVDLHPQLCEGLALEPELPLAVAALAVFLSERQPPVNAPGDELAPWHIRDGFRINLPTRDTVTFAQRKQPLAVEIVGNNPFQVLLGEHEVRLSAELTSRGLRIRTDQRDTTVPLRMSGDDVEVVIHGVNHRFKLFDFLAAADESAVSDGIIRSPLPGQVIEVRCKPEQQVAAGDVLLIVEAMKMEHTLTATQSGRVVQLNANVGDKVDEGSILVEVKPG